MPIDCFGLQGAQSHEDQSDSRGIVLSNVVAEREVLTNVLRSGQRTQRLHQYCQMKIDFGCTLNQAMNLDPQIFVQYKVWS